MAKKVKAIIKLQIPAGKANPSPPVGPALGAQGVAIMDFCKQFNAETQELGDTIVPVIITVYEDRSFSFIKKTAPAVVLIKKKINLKSGAEKVGYEIVGKITKKDLEEIAKIKQQDLQDIPIDSIVKSLMGTARSMGVEVI